MSHSKLKIFLCLTVCLMFLCAPFLLEIYPDGKTYALSSRSANKRSNVIGNSGSGDDDSTFGYKIVKEPDGNTDPVKVPEPATWLLLGAGAAGLAAFKKKLKKK